MPLAHLPAVADVIHRVVPRLPRIGSWVAVLAWWLVSFGLMWQVTNRSEFTECHYGDRGRNVQLAIGVLGSALATRSLMVAPAHPRRRLLVIEALVVLWLLVVLVWMPSLPQQCEN